jgi:Tol biopolymer transport system component
MELLEGETLSRRLEKGPLAAPDALALGIQVADALDSAHCAGVTHRDLKPGNIMLTPAGFKLMDFGLARAPDMEPAEGLLTDSPTMSRPLTAEGTIVGTFQYMAPEQMAGKSVDSRSDIWALGCVLYEALTGRRAFEADSQASLIAAIMDRDPPGITELKPMTPPALDHAVRRCLAKEPGDRWQNARDVMHELKWIAEASSLTGIPGTVSPKRQRRTGWAWRLALGATVIVLAATATLLVRRWTHSAPAPALSRFAVAASGEGTLVNDVSAAAISPDGRRLVFSVGDSAGNIRLWVRAMDSLRAQVLPGTEQAFCPFWSPDSRSVAFFSGGKLKRVPVDGGGQPAEICDAPSGRGGSWNKDGVIVFAPRAVGPLFRVSADGGAAVEIAKPDAGRGETGLRFPCFLPDGEHFLYVSLWARQEEGMGVYLGALDSTEPQRLMSAQAAPIYAEPGYLLYAQGDRIIAQRFNLSGLRLAGQKITLGEAPPFTSFTGAPVLSASVNGVLAHPAVDPPDMELEWLDRTGRSMGAIGLPGGCFFSPSLSPDDRKVALGRLNSMSNWDLWSLDLERAIPTRLTFDGRAVAGPGVASSWFWSPDSKRIAYMRSRAAGGDVYQVPASGTGKPEPLVESDVVFKAPMAWSPDGKYLVFSQNDGETGWDLWLLPLTGDRKPRPYLRTPFDEITASISPDGRWLAYDSDESGTPEIYVRSFPEPGEKHRVSNWGGTYAQWSRDGRELVIFTFGMFFFGSGPVYSVDVETNPTFKAGTPRLLFRPRQDLLGLTATSDLKRFIVAVPVPGAPPPSVTVTLNWPAMLKR